MSLVAQKAPDFNLTAVKNGEFIDNFTMSQFEGKNYVVLFFYPADFTFVCPTELHEYQAKLAEFKELGAEVVAASTDSKFSHLAWLETEEKVGGIKGVSYPIVADFNKTMARDYGVLLEEGGVALRGTFIIDKEGTVHSEVINHLSLGRNIDETLRTLKALKYTEEHGEVCPANWNEGDKTMVPTQDGLKAFFG
ncbi:peroxiredoxin [Myxococcota bacterium]|nr:peroxiredoxin [Myxococcota bacterium]